MGFFDSFQKGFKDESQKSAERQQHSNYRTVKQRESDQYNAFDRQSDGALLSKINGIFTSDEDKAIIDRILRSRGYTKTSNGAYRRL